MHQVNAIVDLAFELAVENGRINVIKLLIDVISTPVCDVLVTAAANNRLEVLEFMLNYCMTHQSHSPRLQTSITAVAETAAWKHYIDVAKLVVDKCASFDTGRALGVAVKKNDSEMVHVFVETSSVASIQDAVVKAAVMERDEILAILLEYSSSDTVEKALVRVEALGKPATSKLLLTKCESNAYSRIFDNAAVHGLVGLVSLLLDKMNSQSIRCGLISAAIYGHTEVVRVLMDECDSTGIMCAFEMAALRGRLGVVELLRDRCEASSIRFAISAGDALGPIHAYRMRQYPGAAAPAYNGILSPIEDLDQRFLRSGINGNRSCAEFQPHHLEHSEPEGVYSSKTRSDAHSSDQVTSPPLSFSNFSEMLKDGDELGMSMVLGSCPMPEKHPFVEPDTRTTNKVTQDAMELLSFSLIQQKKQSTVATLGGADIAISQFAVSTKPATAARSNLESQTFWSSDEGDMFGFSEPAGPKRYAKLMTSFFICIQFELLVELLGFSNRARKKVILHEAASAIKCLRRECNNLRRDRDRLQEEVNKLSAFVEYPELDPVETFQLPNQPISEFNLSTQQLSHHRQQHTTIFPNGM
ncbi:unnamed protein product [Phytophthora lilii]|uniref:Unnamed protein product n=1 Tax=Phytophthora lilii TaxID=2077276 RepID=A0A9W6XCU0_9STRA|nr:unnamed protein product [Phytophthora lilii]